MNRSFVCEKMNKKMAENKSFGDKLIWAFIIWTYIYTYYIHTSILIFILLFTANVAVNNKIYIIYKTLINVRSRQTKRLLN